MKLTPFGFVALAESFLQDALSAPPLTGGRWGFQRAVNFTDHTGELQVLLSPTDEPAKPRVSLHARLTGTAKEARIQGWTDFHDNSERDVFVLRQSDSTRAEEEIFDIVDRLLSRLPEWDESAAITRPVPVPPPRPTFEPLIPEIQTIEPFQAPETPVAEITVSDVSRDDFASSQAFIDSLLSPEAFEMPSAGEAPAPVDEEPVVVVEPPEAVVEEVPAPVAEEPAPVIEEPAALIAEEPVKEEPVKKAKATKPKGTKKAAK
jgi:hypothetical protein